MCGVRLSLSTWLQNHPAGEGTSHATMDRHTPSRAWGAETHPVSQPHRLAGPPALLVSALGDGGGRPLLSLRGAAHTQRQQEAPALPELSATRDRESCAVCFTCNRFFLLFSRFMRKMTFGFGLVAIFANFLEKNKTDMLFTLDLLKPPTVRWTAAKAIAVTPERGTGEV